MPSFLFVSRLYALPYPQSNPAHATLQTTRKDVLRILGLLAWCMAGMELGRDLAGLV
jgi:hypothetical protein